MWEEYGEAEWPRLFQPAIGYADSPLDQETAAWLGSEYAAFPAHAQEIYGPDGVPLAAGESLVQDDLADSLRLISEEGSEAVYEGRLGAATAAARTAVSSRKRTCAATAPNGGRPSASTIAITA